MTKTISIVCMVALGIGVCVGADAKKPAPVPKVQKWNKEPDGFVGIKFGVPMSVPACPTEVIGGAVIGNAVIKGVTTIDYESLKKLGGVCMDETFPGGRLTNTPDLGFNYGVTIGSHDNIPTDFTIISGPSAFDALSAAFIARYGQPTSRAKSIAKTIGGAEFDNEELQWIGEHVHIVMRKYSDQVDRSETTILDEDYWGPKERARADAAAAGVGKL